MILIDTLHSQCLITISHCKCEQSFERVGKNVAGVEICNKYHVILNVSSIFYVMRIMCCAPIFSSVIYRLWKFLFECLKKSWNLLMFIILFIPISIQLVMSSSKFIVKVALDIGGAFFEVE